LAVDNKELVGHGKSTHHEGFGSPIGLLADQSTPLESMTDNQLAALGLVMRETAALTFASGVKVTGKVAYIDRENGKVVLIGFDDCTVTYKEKTLFRSNWGTYDMAVGEKIVSVFAGAADRESFATGTHQPSALKAKYPAYTAEQKRLHQLYQQVRDLREQPVGSKETEQALQTVLTEVDQQYPTNWLIRLEVLEILVERQLLAYEQTRLRQQLEKMVQTQAENAQLIENGLSLLAG
ncbi:phenylalanine 4-monooxygenase, partial [Bradyrhizobium japonicum]